MKTKEQSVLRTIAIYLIIILALILLFSCKKEFQYGDPNICIKGYKVYNSHKELVYTHCREYRDGKFSRSFAIDTMNVRRDPTLGCVKVWSSYPDGECIVCHNNLW